MSSMCFSVLITALWYTTVFHFLPLIQIDFLDIFWYNVEQLFNIERHQLALPDHITRVVVLQHQTLNLLVQLHAAEDIVGVLSSWQKQLGPQFARFMPEIGQLATPGDLTQVNIESLLALRPQVVFVANYAPPAMIAQIQQAGIPVVAISLRHDAAGEKNKMNPTMADEEQAYNAGLMEGIRLIGEVVERQPEAEALIHYTFEARKQANAPVADIPQNQRVRVYMANLRRKLEDDPARPQHLLTESGVGYRLLV